MEGTTADASTLQNGEKKKALYQTLDQEGGVGAGGERR